MAGQTIVVPELGTFSIHTPRMLAVSRARICTPKPRLHLTPCHRLALFSQRHDSPHYAIMRFLRGAFVGRTPMLTEQARQIVQRARDRLASPDRVALGAFAVTRDGLKVHPCCRDTYRFCSFRCILSEAK